MKRLLWICSAAVCLAAGCRSTRPVSTVGVTEMATDVLTAAAEGEGEKAYETYWDKQAPPKSRGEWLEVAAAVRERMGEVRSVTHRSQDQRLDYSPDGYVYGDFYFDVQWEKGAGEALIGAVYDRQAEAWRITRVHLKDEAGEPIPLPGP